MIGTNPFISQVKTRDTVRNSVPGFRGLSPSLCLYILRHRPRGAHAPRRLWRKTENTMQAFCNVYTVSFSTHSTEIHACKTMKIVYNILRLGMKSHCVGAYSPAQAVGRFQLPAAAYGFFCFSHSDILFFARRPGPDASFL